ncbi:hypothetical protein KFL_003510100 [Klebsormidium nitens]|uniref:Uncharacterized protein n=1 Tax=Klebsormidium nitens TaxID=105231 RepID=A0A1Y1IF79_KLENI|nr:hypothetical protein KFL_003510100 [Klebsormidium nitens]|eukprot:GAQ87416.1 hypothetical protein KFL_003510100 [Klebsormidium nitens]
MTPLEPAQPKQSAPTAEELALARETVRRRRAAEKMVETMIVNCRFFTLAGVVGSLTGSLLCFLKGSYYVSAAVVGYVMMLLEMPNRCKVVLKLIEALDTYLVGTVMLIFGMGLYELFVMKLDGAVGPESGSTLFGLFPLEKRPAWLAIKGLDDLKTKLGHVIVMILLVGMFEKSKIVQPTCSLDLFLTAGSVLLCAGSLFLLSRLKPDAKPGAETAGLH